MWEADRTNGILYWAYDDSITEETDPNCAKWFSINGTRHPVADRKVPGVQVDGLSVFHFNTNYGSISVAAVDSEGVSSPAVASGQAVPPATYVIKYDGNEATGGTAPASQNKTQYTDITLATNSGGLTRIGYRFTGWNTAPDGNGTTYSPGATYSADESVTLYAKWEAVDAVVLTPESGAVDHGATVTLTPPKSDATIYYRIGDAVEVAGTQGQPVTVTLYNRNYVPQDATGAEIPEGGNVTITAYAVYADGAQSSETTGTYTLNQYTVRYEGNGNTSGDVPAEQFYSGGSVTVQGEGSLKKTGYTFTGWQGNDGQSYSQGGVYGEDENLTLTAQWEQNAYTVQFDPNGGSYGAVNLPTQQFTYDVEQKLDWNPFGAPTTDCEFVGWKDDDGNVYTDGEEVKNLTTEPDGTVTLYAQWGRKLKDSAQVPSGYTSPHAPSTGSWKYVEFGYWPQTVKADGVTVDTKLSKEVGMFTYYLGSDSNYYVQGSGNYYKVEPIRWRVLTENYIDADGIPTGNALLLAEKILTGGIDWDANVVVGNITQSVASNYYISSNIRRWLNGNTEEKGDSSDYKGTPGFLQTAFTTDAQGKIAPTIVNNTADSTTPTNGGFVASTFIGSNTTDKIFLLSMKEATTAIYGFAESFDNNDSARSRVPTDYAQATGATGGWWWLRSSFYESSSTVRTIHSPGSSLYRHIVYNIDGGVVPALCIPADQLPLP